MSAKGSVFEIGTSLEVLAPGRIFERVRKVCVSLYSQSATDSSADLITIFRLPRPSTPSFTSQQAGGESDTCGQISSAFTRLQSSLVTNMVILLLSLSICNNDRFELGTAFVTAVYKATHWKDFGHSVQRN